MEVIILDSEFIFQRTLKTIVEHSKLFVCESVLIPLPHLAHKYCIPIKESPLGLPRYQKIQTIITISRVATIRQQQFNVK